MKNEIFLFKTIFVTQFVKRFSFLLLSLFEISLDFLVCQRILTIIMAKWIKLIS